ncbi:MAG: hypothetical protein UU30_C0002G0069 [Candidatus Nomurabacteria bacterium GW2011_GWA2_40_97]|nr:MAG: hypothetical protein UU30_C0002G0069 [Candidatus Nomurabacteria bacterium GW2011_GWA2_40_97]
MSNWFLLALIAPILWSIVNHIDKYMLSKYLKDRGVGALLIFSALSSVLILPIIAFFYRSEIFNISGMDFLILIFVGFLSSGAFYFYLAGMEMEEASIVVPLFQLSLEIDEENKLKFKTKVLILIATSSFLFALHDTLFKKVAIVENFWVSVFWQYASLTIFGLLILVGIKKFRKEFFGMFFNNMGKKIFFVNIMSEILYILGNLANNFATLLAPVAVVLVVSSYQPLFVFIGGVLLTIFLPKIATERISRKHLFHKLISIIIIIIGSYLLYTTSN